MERIADYVIRSVLGAGAEHIFMVTGRGILYLSDAVAKNEKMTGVSMLHEQGASYAAMSYAKAREGLGACLVSTGCAAANAITGALCAYQDNLPVVFISGQHMLNETTRYTKTPIRTYGSQEADIISLAEPVTKYAVMITTPNRVVYEVEKALYLAQSGRKGPVWIDIPLDLQSVRIEPDELEHFDPAELEAGISEAKAEADKVRAEVIKAKAGLKAADSISDATAAEIAEVVNRLNMAERPLIFIGGGASSCKEEIKRFAEGHRMPVVSSFAACDIYGSGNEYSIGVAGSLGAPRPGCFALQNADYVLVIGSKMCSQTIGDKAQYIAREAYITVVDIDPNEHSKKGIHIDQLIICDAKAFLDKLSGEQVKECPKKWLEKCLHWKQIFAIGNENFIKPDPETGRMDLYDFSSRLGKLLGERTAVITDAGLEELIVPSVIPYKGGQKCFFPAAQGAMGYAIPAIIGVYYGGYEDIAVVVGDGSIMMNVQELQLLNYHNIRAKIFVINNDMYAVIRARQKDLFRMRTIGNDSGDGVPTPDFEKLSAAFGLPYITLQDENSVDEGLKEILGRKESLICEVMCKTEQRYFHTSFRKNEKGKLVRPSIEDMSPFMDRTLFLSEMIVEPVEV